MEEEHQSILAHHLLNYEAAKLPQWEPHSDTEEEPNRCVEMGLG